MTNFKSQSTRFWPIDFRRHSSQCPSITRLVCLIIWPSLRFTDLRTRSIECLYPKTSRSHLTDSECLYSKYTPILFADCFTLTVTWSFALSLSSRLCFLNETHTHPHTWAVWLLRLPHAWLWAPNAAQKAWMTASCFDSVRLVYCYWPVRQCVPQFMTLSLFTGTDSCERVLLVEPLSLEPI